MARWVVFLSSGLLPPPGAKNQNRLPSQRRRVDAAKSQKIRRYSVFSIFMCVCVRTRYYTSLYCCLYLGIILSQLVPF